MKKYIEYLTSKSGLRLVSLVILVLSISAVFQSVLSARDVKRIVSEDFNFQQLELARHAAGIMTKDFKILKRELTTLSLSPSIQYVEPVSWANRMKISFSAGQDYGLIRIILINAAGDKTYSTNYTNAVFVEDGSYGEEDYFIWCSRPENKSRIYITETVADVVEDSEPGFVVHMAIPVYQVSTDDAHPEPTHQFSGVLVFVLDAGRIARKVVGPMRSGKTGYAWVIDESGAFLYHLDEDFIGQNAFEIRKFKDPHISFSEINLIQKTKMLEGEEGTSWYISGWHRGIIGRMKKLIAYAPVQIGAANHQQIWSVAVVAPASEVEDAIHGVYLRQIMVQGAFIAALIIILIVFISLERFWLHSLQRMVQEKTSDLERYAKELGDSERRYRLLIESADDLIITLDRDGNIESVNDYYTRLTGVTCDNTVGRKLTDVIEYAKPDMVYEKLRKVRENRTTIGDEEQARVGNRVHWLDTKYQPIQDSDGDLTSILVIARDITVHKNIEAQLFQAEKMASLGSLSAGVAHEINNPIAVILGFTEMLLERCSQDTEEYEILKTIERQGLNCQRIVENLLAFSRIPKEASEETDLVDDLQRVVNVVMNTLVTKKIDLKTNIEAGLPKVKGDGRQLEQVFFNIINNAISAMENGGVLTISARRGDGMVNIGFMDSGPGITPDIMDKIFEPFFTTKKVGEGTGLGLSVSYGIIKKFGGDIAVDSRTGDKSHPSGTTFMVRLPLSNIVSGGGEEPDVSLVTKGEDHDG